MAVVPLTEAGYSPEDLLRLEHEGRFELVDGELQQRPPMGAEANLIATELMTRAAVFATAHGLGLCFTQECG